MADKKISELTALTGANVADTDLLPIVDISETETKKITFGEFKTALDTATGFVRITGDTMTGNLSFGDNVKANFGDSDLQIYHNGTDSFIDEANASGWLYIRGNDIVIGKYTGETYFKGIADGAVELYHDNALKLATTATGIDVTGTTGMRSDGGGYLVKFLNSSSTSELSGFIYDNNQDNIEFTAYDSSYALAFKTNNTERMRIDSSGNVGIGVVPETGWRTAGGEKVLQLDTASIYNNSGNDLYINSNWYLNSSAQSTYIESDFATSYSQQSGKHIWYNAASGTAGNAVTFTQAMTLDASGNVGIGTSSPSVTLHVKSANPVFGLETTGTVSAGGTVYSELKDSTGTVFTSGFAGLANCYQFSTIAAAGFMRFLTGAQVEALRIDSSGNLLVGTTDNNVSDNSGASNGGINIGTAGVKGVISAAAGQTVAYLNRLGSDGDIAVFRKDGTTVGSIGSKVGNLTIGNGDTGLYFAAGADAIYPYNTSTQADRDAAVDLGYSTVRFKDLYLSGGVYLGGTGSANYLSDYEEGTFTPTIIGTTTAGTGTYTTQVGAYTKVGRAVTIQIRLSWTAHTGTGFMFVSGLPFTTLSSGVQPSFTVGDARDIALTASNILQLFSDANTTTIQFIQTPTGGGASANVTLDTSATIILAGTYFV